MLCPPERRGGGQRDPSSGWSDVVDLGPHAATARRIPRRAWGAGLLVLAAVVFWPLLAWLVPTTAVPTAVASDHLYHRPVLPDRDPWGSKYVWDEQAGCLYSAGPNRVPEGGRGDDVPAPAGWSRPSAGYLALAATPELCLLAAALLAWSALTPAFRRPRAALPVECAVILRASILPALVAMWALLRAYDVAQLLPESVLAALCELVAPSAKPFRTVTLVPSVLVAIAVSLGALRSLVVPHRLPEEPSTPPPENRIPELRCPSSTA